MAEQNTYLNLWEQLKKYLSLNVENAKLTVAEKATVLFTAAVLVLLGVLFSVIVVFFISIALSDLLAEAVGRVWSLLIVGGFYLLLMVAIYLLRRPLIANPVSRFLTRLLFTP